MIVFAPSTVQETVDLVAKAFDLGDKYRMPVMILSDGMLGQMMEPVELPEPKEVDNDSKEWAACGHKNQRKHNVVNSLYIDPATLEGLVKKRFERYAKVQAEEQMAEEYLVDDADIVLVAYGASARVSRSAVDMARKNGIKAGLIRPITLWPFPVDAIAKAAEHVSKFLTVEMSMGQMVDDVRLAVKCARPVEFYGRTGGLIPTPMEVYNKIVEMNGGEQ